MICNMCPRGCNATRGENDGGGMCGQGTLARVRRTGLHMWEEPCISGTRGSGTVFFEGCPLHCVYCQNREISFAKSRSAVLTPEQLYAVYINLRESGAHNINLVTPTHFTQTIIDSLSHDHLGLPVIWNTSGYEKPETLDMLSGFVNIYLTDMKYGNAETAKKYSSAPDYPIIAEEAIIHMYEQTGDYVIDSEGMMKSGVIIRHLILPDNLENTFDVLDTVHRLFPHGGVLFSLMGQYTPFYTGEKFPELRRTLQESEYRRAEEYMLTLGIFDGYTQALESADKSYTPDFN